MIRAVLDTNVIVAGVIKEEGVSGQILKALFEEGRFILITSPAILEEMRRVLKEENIRKLHGWSDEQIEELVTRLYRVSEVTRGDVRIKVIKEDPDDDKFVACAEEGGAQFIVSGDRHLKELGKYGGIEIISARTFLERLKADIR